MRRQGFILVIVLALLGVLAFLALELVQKSGTARSLSLRQIHKTKSNLAARSGLDKAVAAVQLRAYRHPNNFELQIESAGEDRNRNGTLDPTEDANANGRLNLHQDLSADLTPSLALAEDPMAPSPKSWVITMDGVTRGATWTDSKASPTILTSAHIARSVLDLNAGVDSGRGAEGKRYEQDHALAYSANDPDHPFNQPFVRLLNAWGNVLKYRHMVRPEKTYNWQNPIDVGDNLPDIPPGGSTFSLFSPQMPGAKYDQFRPSGIFSFEDGLGDKLIEARPPMGFASVEEAERIFLDYIDSWDAEVMTYVPIDDPIPLPDIPGLLQEFRSLAVTHIPRQDVYLLIPGQVNMGVVDATNVFFDDAGLRQRVLNCRPYALKTHLININGAAPSLIAALIYGTGYPDAWTYDITNTTKPLTYARLNYSRYFLENMWCNQYSTIPPIDPMRFVVDHTNPPIMSMTEGTRLAFEFVQSRPWSDLQKVGQFIRSWPRGYDGKDISANNSTNGLHKTRFANMMANNHFYLDASTDNRREKILSHLLNPHVNLASVIYDEALPQPIENLANSLGSSLYQVYESWGSVNAARSNNSYSRRIFCDKSGASGRMAGWLAIDHGDCLFSLLGSCHDPQGRTLAASRIITSSRVYETLHVHSQKDWQSACKDPNTGDSTLGDDWTTYPESPGVPPATWDGHLALKPSNNPVAPWGTNLRARVPLNAFTPGQHPASDITGKAVWPRGPRVLASSSGRRTNALRNSLNPAPGMPERSLLASGYHAIDTISDLMPGGGYRVSPFHNSTGVWNHPTPSGTLNDPYRKEAILSLRNALVDDADDMACPDPGHTPISPPSHLISSLSSGAVSFYFKPRFTYPTHSVNNHIPNWTLFSMPFVVQDKETRDRCSLNPAYAPTADLRKWYSGQIRLSWAPIPNIAYAFNNRPNPFPHAGSYTGFSQIDTAGVYHYFTMMKGLPFGGGLAYGNILALNTRDSGSTTGTSLFAQFPWSNTVASGSNLQLGAWNTPPLESLVLEFSISKFASIDETNGSYNLSILTTGFPGYHWNQWNADDAMSTLGMSCAYFQPDDKPLHLFDTSGDGGGGAFGEFHSVRKAFFINHPVDISATASRGRSLLSKDFHHQPMVAPGRWNHFFIAWKNLWSLMSNSNPSHMGGCLAVYLNGAFAKTVSATHPVDGYASSYRMSGLFVQSDYSEAFMSGGTPGTSGAVPDRRCPWEPTDYHPLYSVAPYPAYRAKVYHVPACTLSTLVAMAESFHVPWFGEFGTPNIKISEMGYERACVTSDKIGYLSPYLHKSTPPRLYFGCQPVAPFNHRDREHYIKPYGIPFGTFMDIQVFDSPSDTLSDGQAGFVRSLVPPINNFSVFPSNSTMTAYPLNNHRFPKGLKVAALRMSAHLPEFHKFWDDQSSLQEGPDSEDSQEVVMKARISGSEVALLGRSQDPAYSSYCDPETCDAWLAPSPIPVHSSGDLKLTIDFKNSQTPVARNTMSTPIIEDIDVTLLGNVEFLNFRME